MRPGNFSDPSAPLPVKEYRFDPKIATHPSRLNRAPIPPDNFFVAGVLFLGNYPYICLPNSFNYT